MRGEGHDTEPRQVSGLDHAFVGILTQMEHLCRIDLQRKGNGFEFVRGVGQTRQVGSVDLPGLYRSRPSERRGIKFRWLHRRTWLAPQRVDQHRLRRSTAGIWYG